MATLSAIKAQSKARDIEERRALERKRNVMVLVMRHLADHGYVESYERLCSEANLSLDRVRAFALCTRSWGQTKGATTGGTMLGTGCPSRPPQHSVLLPTRKYTCLAPNPSLRCSLGQ